MSGGVLREMSQEVVCEDWHAKTDLEGKYEPGSSPHALLKGRRIPPR